MKHLSNKLKLLHTFLILFALFTLFTVIMYYNFISTNYHFRLNHCFGWNVPNYAKILNCSDIDDDSKQIGAKIFVSEKDYNKFQDDISSLFYIDKSKGRDEYKTDTTISLPEWFDTENTILTYQSYNYNASVKEFCCNKTEKLCNKSTKLFIEKSKNGYNIFFLGDNPYNEKENQSIFHNFFHKRLLSALDNICITYLRT